MKKCKKIHLGDFIKFVFFYSYILVLVALFSHIMVMIIDLFIMWKQALYGNHKGTVFPVLEGTIIKEKP